MRVRLENLEDLRIIRPLLERKLEEGCPIDMTFSGRPSWEGNKDGKSEQAPEKVESEKIREEVRKEIWERYDEIFALFLGILISLAAEVTAQIFDFLALGLAGLVLFILMVFIARRAYLEYRKELAERLVCDA